MSESGGELIPLFAFDRNHFSAVFAHIERDEVACQTLILMNAAAIPLCVDLDGTLTPVDTLQELLLDMARREPRALLQMPLWLARGRAWFKAQAAKHGHIDAQVLPYREDLLEWLRKQKAAGRRLVLATVLCQLSTLWFAVLLGMAAATVLEWTGSSGGAVEQASS